MNESPERRSSIMRAVKGADTGPEMVVRRLTHALGFRFRLHRADLPGKPDLVFPRLRKVIFVNGCFWHGHNCNRGARIPVHNRDYWEKKIARNRERDRKSQAALRAANWDVLVIWECELRDSAEAELRFKKFLTERRPH